MLRAAVEPGLLAVHEMEAEFGGDHRPVSHRRQRLAYDLLVDEGAIDFRSVEKRHTPLKCGADHGDAVVLAEGRAVTEAQPHAAEADGRDFKTAFAQHPLLHETPF